MVTLPPSFESSLESVFLKRRRAMTAGSRLPRPMSASSSSRERAPPSRTTRSQAASSTSATELFRPRSAWSSSRSPRPADSSYCMVLRKCRMLERALPVRTYCSQPALGLAWLAVMISARSPSRRSVRSGTSSAFDLPAAPQRKDLALGRENVDLVGEEIDLHVLEELLRVARLVLDLEQRLQPAVRLLLQLGELLGIVLVHPVRGHTRLGQAMHLLGAHL